MTSTPPKSRRLKYIIALAILALALVGMSVFNLMAHPVDASGRPGYQTDYKTGATYVLATDVLLYESNDLLHLVSVEPGRNRMYTDLTKIPKTFEEFQKRTVGRWPNVRSIIPAGTRLKLVTLEIVTPSFDLDATPFAILLDGTPGLRVNINPISKAPLPGSHAPSIDEKFLKLEGK